MPQKPYPPIIVGKDGSRWFMDPASGRAIRLPTPPKETK